MKEHDFLNPTPEIVYKAITENVYLTRSFRLGEFLVSQTALRRGINNTPGPRELTSLYLLCRHVLQPIRDHFGYPVVISSGLRVPLLNRAIGGKLRSQHILGQAADFHLVGTDMALEQVAQKIVEAGMVFDQLILEFHYRNRPGSGWIHVSYAPGKAQRQQVLTIDRHGTRLGLDLKDY